MDNIVLAVPVCNRTDCCRSQTWLQRKVNQQEIVTLDKKESVCDDVEGVDYCDPLHRYNDSCDVLNIDRHYHE